MKFIKHIVLLGSGAVLFASCYKDKGNYSYKEPEEITISGIEGSYTKISLVDRIALDPQVSSTDPDAEYSYFWGIYETNVQGSVPKVDTIGRTKALDYLVVQPAKGWVLVFGAKNLHTGYSKIVTSSINVVTQFSRGWYVLKSNGAGSDVDLFLTPTAITPSPATPTENVFSLVNEKGLAGTGGSLSFCTNYKSTVTGSLANTRALFILSGNDATVVNINTFKEIRDFQKLFYFAPTVKSPAYVGEGSQANYLMNDGKLHSIYNMAANTGQFGGVTLRDDVNSPYNLSKYVLNYSFGNPFFFDETSSSFVSCTGGASVLSRVSDAVGSEMPANNNNKKLLFMGVKTTSPYSGYAVFQDKTDPTLKMLSFITPSSFNLKIDNDTLAPTDKMYNAEKYLLNYADEGIIYFTSGSEVWSRNLVNRAELKQFTLPVGEEVTFISHRKYTSEAAFAYNYIMVGTKVGTKYKIRMFKKTSGNLAATPDFVLEGNGSPADVIYMSPSVSGTTYPNQ